MWIKWLPWRYIVKRVAQARGFVDPIKILSQLENFAKPSEVRAPVELLRLAAVLQARGLMNSQAIQHNLDWVWPYWVIRQFDPRDRSFVPRAFSLTHINLTNRNWTAVGLPDSSDYPIVDPRGLVTPFYDGWSVDCWILDGQNDLIPSKLLAVDQKLFYEKNLLVQTVASSDGKQIIANAEMVRDRLGTVCRLSVTASSPVDASLVISVRPYNPEGVSFIHTIEKLKKDPGLKVNGKQSIYLNEAPAGYFFSSYDEGDVFHNLAKQEVAMEVSCNVGMATAAIVYRLKKENERKILVDIPLCVASSSAAPGHFFSDSVDATAEWQTALRGVCSLTIPDERLSYLYQASLRTIVLFSPKEIYAGPYTYKHFWFRDAAFIVHALLAAGLQDRSEKVLNDFLPRQRATGYFCSQDGEWDSNGQVLWVLNLFYEWTGQRPSPQWLKAIGKAAKWIQRKRLSKIENKPHAGLFPPGFSAEHLGPNDFYYWDDFWGVAGLKAAASLLRDTGSADSATYEIESERFLKSIEASLALTEVRLRSHAMPASPYRRLDSGSIGSLAAAYPLGLWPPQDPRIVETSEFLLTTCFVDGGFFHNMSHSGINPYLTLYVAQSLLRAGDERYWRVVKDLAALASSTGQWPEAIHAQTGGGCMGDGEHVWAAAEWILMMRALFLQEEEDRLILGCGIPPEWLQQKHSIEFGPTPTKFGPITIKIDPSDQKATVSWAAAWRKAAPKIVVALFGEEPCYPEKGVTSFVCPLRGSK